MRFFSLIPALAALVTIVAGAALPRADGDCVGSEMGCDVAQSATKRDFSGRGLSNAALLRRGLALKNPILRRGSPVRRSGPSGVPKPPPSPPPNTVHHRGVIAVAKLSDKSILGYVSSSALSTGQYGYDKLASALIVSFDTPKGGPATKLNLVAENADSGFSLVGMVQGRDDTDSNLAPGSFKYTYLAGTASTPPGSIPLVVGNSYVATPGRTSESAVWTFDSGTNLLSPFWVNSDKSLPPMQYFVQSTGVYMGSDANAFRAKFPAPVDNVALVFVPI